MVMFLLKKYWMEIGEWDLGIFSSFDKASNYASQDFKDTCSDEDLECSEDLEMIKLDHESSPSSQVWRTRNDLLPDVWYYIESYVVDGAIVRLSG